MNEFERACYLPNLIEPQQTVSSGNGQGFLFLLSRYIPLAELSKKKTFSIDDKRAYRRNFAEIDRIGLNYET